MPKTPGPDSGIAILDWISDQTREQLAAGAVLSSPCCFPEGAFSLVIQRFSQEMPLSMVRIDALVPEGRKALTWDRAFEIRAGESRLAACRVTVPPSEGDHK